MNPRTMETSSPPPPRGRESDPSAASAHLKESWDPVEGGGLTVEAGSTSNGLESAGVSGLERPAIGRAPFPMPDHDSLQDSTSAYKVRSKAGGEYSCTRAFGFLR